MIVLLITKPTGGRLFIANKRWYLLETYFCIGTSYFDSTGGAHEPCSRKLRGRTEAPRRNFPPRGRTENQEAYLYNKNEKKVYVNFFQPPFWIPEEQTPQERSNIRSQFNWKIKPTKNKQKTTIFKNEDRCAFCEHREW